MVAEGRRLSRLPASESCALVPLCPSIIVVAKSRTRGEAERWSASSEERTTKRSIDPFLATKSVAETAPRPEGGHAACGTYPGAVAGGRWPPPHAARLSTIVKGAKARNGRKAVLPL